MLIYLIDSIHAPDDVCEWSVGLLIELEIVGEIDDHASRALVLRSWQTSEGDGPTPVRSNFLSCTFIIDGLFAPEFGQLWIASDAKVRYRA